VGTTWTVALRRGSCASLGALILSTRVTASSTGRLSRTITMTTAQTRAAKLPLTLRVGTRCSSFTAPAVVPGTFGDGIFRVGAGGIQPGTYRTAGIASCYWARLWVFGGSDILANGAGSGPAVVTIFPDDGGFKSSGCGTWQLNAPAVPTATPGDGVWRVGVDIKPSQVSFRQPFVVIVFFVLHSSGKRHHRQVMGVHDVIDVTGKTHGEFGVGTKYGVAAAGGGTLDIHGGAT
jgi:hypothetical protein